MPTITVNDRIIKAEDDETILSACKKAGVNIPTLCHMSELLPSGACRLCVVEVDGFNNLIPACSYPIQEGMEIKTHSARALKARKTIIELLLANHPDDCLYCPRNNNCSLQDLAADYDVTQRRYQGDRQLINQDLSSPAIVRDPEKCILCGKCVRMCEEIQGVAALDFIGRGSDAKVGTAFDKGLNISSCINCGQCIMVCPTGALTEQSHMKKVIDAIQDPEKTVVVQHAPSISVTIAEEFGLKPGQDYAGALNTALRRLGFNVVFDTSFSADLTIMEEASELVHRIQNDIPLPMMTSCSPGWIKFIEQFYPDMLAHVSSCKSPQQMLGAIIKSYWSKQNALDPSNIFSVAIMPCTAKKFEAERPEMANDGNPDIDAVLTTREIVKLIKMRGMHLENLEPQTADMPFGERSSAGKIFGTSGGVTEAAIRTAHYLLTGQELKELRLKEIRGHEGIKEAQISIGDLTLKIAVVSGLQNARKVLDEMQAGTRHYDFIEVMTCPGGCIAGGGQPINTDKAAVKARMQALYKIDRDAPARTSHQNESIQKLYRDFLGKPLGKRSHTLLHTSYHKRDVLI